MIDHVALAVPDLAAGVAAFQELTGVPPLTGGSHAGLGTANNLVGLGVGAYLEIIGPDPDQPEPVQPRPFGLDRLSGARVVGWCVRPPDLNQAVATARARGYDPGTPRTMSRRQATGVVLSWRLTRLPVDLAQGVVPFMIDWGTTPHPTTGPLPSLTLRSSSAEHPDPAEVSATLAALGVDLPVHPVAQPRLLLEVETARGPIVLT